MHRRSFVTRLAASLLTPATLRAGHYRTEMDANAPTATGTLKLFLCGDVMIGRGIDQVLPHPGDPALHETWVRDAREYVRLAEQAHGPIAGRVGFEYVWGAALEELERAAPQARIVNLETSITTSDRPWPGKGIHYRMHPANTPCLAAAAPDCCVLANNHVLDWGREGLLETLGCLEDAGLQPAGAGRDVESAAAPAIIELGASQRILVFAAATESAGVPRDWAAGPGLAGIHLIEPGPAAADVLAERIAAARRPGDLVVLSLHWGGNWGYRVPAAHRDFAHRCIDVAGVHVVHGHSSHHPLGLEIYRGQLIIYGCGDFLNDYEGIGGHESYRPGLTLMYLPEFDRGNGALAGLELVPMRIRRFRLERATAAEAAWLAARLDRESSVFDTHISITGSARMKVAPRPAPLPA